MLKFKNLFFRTNSNHFACNVSWIFLHHNLRQLWWFCQCKTSQMLHLHSTLRVTSTDCSQGFWSHDMILVSYNPHPGAVAALGSDDVREQSKYLTKKIPQLDFCEKFPWMWTTDCSSKSLSIFIEHHFLEFQFWWHRIEKYKAPFIVSFKVKHK